MAARESAEDWNRIALGLRRRDPAVLQELMDRYHQRLRNYVWSVVGRGDVADDILQETWVRVLERGHQYDPAGGRFDAWLYAVARNRCMDHFRARPVLSLELLQQPEEDSVAFDPVADGPSPLDHLRIRERSAAIGDALKRLNPIHREVLVLHFYEDLTMREIAEITGIRMATVKSRLYRAISFFEGLLREGMRTAAIYTEAAAGA